MSLINDALKRAKDAQRNDSPSSVPPMRPAESNQPKGENSNLILPAIIIVLVVIAIFFLVASPSRHTTKPSVAGATAAPPVAAVAAPILAPTKPLSTVAQAEVTTNAPKVTRLQGIVYDPVHPWAILNGKTIYVGDSVDGMRVTVISRDAVTLVGNGQTNRFVVGQH